LDYKWEVTYLDDEKLLLRLTTGTERFSPMIVYDSAQPQGWQRKVSFPADIKPGAWSTRTRGKASRRTLLLPWETTDSPGNCGLRSWLCGRLTA